MLPEDGRGPKHVGLLSVLVCVFKIQKVLVHLLVFLGKSTIQLLSQTTVSLSITNIKG
jgi:hypothetical protein